MAASSLLPLLPAPILTSTSAASTVVAITVFVALLCVCILIGHLLEGSRWANESIASLLLGLCAGLVMLLVTRWKSSRILTFDEELFFIYLLPPIIFNAGFQVKKKQFFRNFSTILLFGVLGTLISFCIISTGSYFLFSQIGITSLKIQEYLAIGAIFSATDSVCTLQVLNQEETPLLYSLVFGEGVANDATSIVLFNAVQSLDLSHINAITALKLFGTFLYLFFTSTALGIAVGLVSAYVIKKLYFGRHSTNREVAIMLLLAYLSYMVAELLSLSGILTVFFCGIIMSHYTWHNVTERSRITTRHAFATMSFISETFIFLYVGMDAMDIDKWKRSDAGSSCPKRYDAVLAAEKQVHWNNFHVLDPNLWHNLATIKLCTSATVLLFHETSVSRVFSFMVAKVNFLDVKGVINHSHRRKVIGLYQKDKILRQLRNSAGTTVSASGMLFALVMVGRATFVFSLANVANCSGSESNAKLGLRQQFVIWWAGLMRGAVTIALSYNQFSASSSKEGAFMITNTIIVVLFSTVVFGSVTKPLIRAAVFHNRRLPNDEDTNISSLEDIHLLFPENGGTSDNGNQHANPRSSLGMLIMHPTPTIHYFWRKFDDKYMRRIFGGRGFVSRVPTSAPSVPEDDV